MRPFCATKRQWETFELADGHRLLLLAAGKARDPERLHAYRCPDCGLWHVGHASYPLPEGKRAS